MVNGIYERDYRNCASKILPIGEAEDSSLRYLDPDTDHSIPHVIIPHTIERYEECLRLMNRFAAKYRGMIHAQLDRETHTSVIRIELPVITFEDVEDIDLLSYVSRCAKQLSVTKTAHGLALFVRVNCFAPKL